MKQIENQYDDLRYKTGCYYTNERNKQIIIFLLKKYGVKKVVVSPGATNFALVGSMQHDPYFEMYSCVDERAAAYMAIGMAEKCHEPIVLSCTGATASRNYMAALTYAFQKNLPILVITSSLSLASVGHLKAQVTDRDHAPIDMIYKSYQFDNIKDAEDGWRVNVKCNEALSLLLLFRKPILINVCTTYSLDFSVKELPSARYIPTYTAESQLPSIPDTNICIFIGSHKRFTKDQTQAIERFCECHNAVIMSDHTSGYSGKYRVNMTLPFSQEMYLSPNRTVGLLIHIGEISGDYYTFGALLPQQVWRVNLDGAYSDFFKKLSAVFKMDETDFFTHYTTNTKSGHSYIETCQQEIRHFQGILPTVPFSNIWIANQLHTCLPKGSQIQFGILNSLRSWDFFNLPDGVEGNSNVGGFGIDGCVSSLVGAAITSPDKLFFGVVGDLTFYYDANILLNSAFPKNIRLIIVNNGRGIEFRNYCHPSSMAFGISVDAYVAAAGHFGNQTNSAVVDLCNSAEIEYIPIESKEVFTEIIPKLISQEIDKAIIVECFTNPEDESNALQMYRNCIKDPRLRLRNIAKTIKEKLGI
ncbi:MAG: 2-succinyl-5-enolpyruvyl-6-hydroxy-3-cyclohexene-1-carboxylate synthase [Bacteroidaceae bacterium]|nr:2-succinyl-5-enolpyruvyl-6-hydroxy-3-cyclohexene-1-carboxylate synthase [Bacteroidaceae bacterium]